MLLSWFIVARFIHVMHTFYLREKGNAIEAAVFKWYFLISYCFHRFSCHQIAVNLDPTAVLVWNGNIAEKYFVYFFQQKLFLQISKHSSIQVLKIILTVWTLKNYQSSVTLKNEYKFIKSFRLYMTNKYYISKCFDKGLKETKNALKLETARLFFYFLLREIIYV